MSTGAEATDLLACPESEPQDQDSFRKIQIGRSTHAAVSLELLKVDPQIIRQIRECVLIVAQLPEVLYDSHGMITKPMSW